MTPDVPSAAFCYWYIPDLQTYLGVYMFQGTLESPGSWRHYQRYKLGILLAVGYFRLRVTVDDDLYYDDL